MIPEIDPLIIDTIYTTDTIMVSDTAYFLNGRELLATMSSIPWLGAIDSFPVNVPEGSVFFHNSENLGFGYNEGEWGAYNDDEFEQYITYDFDIVETIIFDTLGIAICPIM